MKKMQEVLGDTSPKNMKQLTRSLSRGEGLEHLSSMQAELNSSYTKDYPLIGCLLTENYLVDYSWAGGFSKATLCIIPIKEITEIYRTNLAPNKKGEWKYDFDSFFLAIHSNSEFRGLYCRTFRSPAKKFPYLETYQQVINHIRGNINSFSGGAAC